MRKWMTRQYEASAWFRLLVMVAATGVNLVIVALIVPIGNDWIVAPLLVLSVFSVAGVTTWFCTARLDKWWE